MPNFRQRKWLLIGIAIAIIILLTLVAAPNSGGRKNESGSTYSRNPNGYGAWYEYMNQKEIPIERWRKPFAQLVKDDVQDVTYVQVLSEQAFLLGFGEISSAKQDWLTQGNTLVVIGKYQPATAAPFESLIPYRRQTLSSSQIAIKTTRRYQKPEPDSNSDSNSDLESEARETTDILKDRYGVVVWSEQIGKGKVIYCTTPYLAANAYQDNPDNYQFLADLVDDRQAIWIDEYIHGYKDQETIAQEQRENVLDYLAKTPWFFLLVQTALIAIVAAITAFRRFGLPLQPKTAIADNSTAYIEALAGVLEKANSTDFVVQAIAKDEQRKLQQSLGLGKSPVDRDMLITAYSQQKSKSAEDLNQLLQVSNANQKISAARLITWIQQWQKINQDN
ncbi:MAG: DUF4350 domain-containing protein [Cyanobacteria bacterium J06631_6]